MFNSVSPHSPSPFLGPRLTTSLREIGWSSKRALQLQTHLPCSSAIWCLVTLISLCFLSYGFILMALFLLMLGSCLDRILSSLSLLGVILFEHVELHLWLLQESLHPSSRPLVDGSQTPLSAIFIAIQLCCRQCSSMVGPFMAPLLLMYYSHQFPFPLFPSTSLSYNTHHTFPSLPSLPFNTMLHCS